MSRAVRAELAQVDAEDDKHRNRQELPVPEAPLRTGLLA
jgi:hypothetical protein